MKDVFTIVWHEAGFGVYRRSLILRSKRLMMSDGHSDVITFPQSGAIDAFSFRSRLLPNDVPYMNRLILSGIAAGVVGFSATGRAVPINLFESGDFPAEFISSITGREGLDSDNLFAWLQIVSQGFTGANFPLPTQNVVPYNGGPIEGDDYLVLFYEGDLSAVPPGSAAGGLEAIFFPEALPSFDVPQIGIGPNGNGPLSFALLYDHEGQQVGTPDGGATLPLLGLSLACMAGFRSFSRRRA